MSPFPLKLYMTPEFLAWRDSLADFHDKRLTSRLIRLSSGHLGDSRSLGDGLFELRWMNGLRVYYTRKQAGGFDSIMLLGGFKGTQYADINKARGLQTRYEQGFETGGADA
jgi:putative addiction module killer protein